MRSLTAAATSLLLVMLVACSFPAVAPDARALTDADRKAILDVLRLSADAKGQVMNECDERVTPEFLPAALGGRVGTAVLFAMSGGPKLLTCYGDGPKLHLMMREAAGWREIYAARGRVLVILPTSTNGVRDIGDGGPGFSFPVWTWNGTRYARTGRNISDAELSKLKAVYLP